MIPLRCILTGNGSLLVGCGDALLQRGHGICAVVSRGPAVRLWAGDRRSAPETEITGLAERAKAGSFERLFSFANLGLIADRSVALPAKRRANFRDAPPPPRNAGPNAAAMGRLAGVIARLSTGVLARLLEMGTSPGRRVRLFVMLAPEPLIGALAILQAGGARVPPDPACPANRIAHLAGDGRARVIVTTLGPALQLPGRGSRVLVRIDAETRAENVNGGATAGDRAQNLFGPAGTALWSATGPVAGIAKGPEAMGTGVEIASVHVLAPRSQPAPVGVPGKLWVEGKGVTRGYRRYPELAETRLRPDPFAAETGLADAAAPRMNRSGDLAGWRPDGRLDCLGRPDHQAKIRGQRIEPGEIEACLNGFAGNSGTEAAIDAVRPRRPCVSDIRSDDTFLALGGHSLRAARRHREIRKALDATGLSITGDFRFPTLGALAANVHLPGTAALARPDVAAPDCAATISERRAPRAGRRVKTG